MKLFIYQEGNHAMLHRNYCNQLRISDNPIIIKMMHDCDAHFNKIKAEIEQSTTLKEKLYFVIISEIFASRFSEYFLESYQGKYQQLDPFASYMNMMHSIEEIEHQSLAFDLYLHLFLLILRTLHYTCVLLLLWVIQ